MKSRQSAYSVLLSLFLALGIGWFLVSLWDRAHWTTATGTVVAQEFPNRRNVRLTIEVETAEGRRRTQATLGMFEASFAQGGGYSPGTSVKVRYNPNDTGEAEVLGWGRWQVPLFAAVLLVIKLFEFICSPTQSARTYRRA